MSIKPAPEVLPLRTQVPVGTQAQLLCLFTILCLPSVLTLFKYSFMLIAYLWSTLLRFLGNFTALSYVGICAL